MWARNRFKLIVGFFLGGDVAQSEIPSSWAIFISICLLITALLTSYLLQQKKIQAVHETVISIFAGLCCPFPYQVRN